MNGVLDIQKLVEGRIEVEGGSCRDSFFQVYVKQGVEGLRKIASGLNEDRIRTRINNFAELGNELEGEEGTCRRLIVDDLAGTAKSIDFDTLKDGLSRAEIEPTLAKLSRVSFWLVEWNNWKKLNQFDRIAA